ncbi:MAG: hypothetical protein KF868_06550 [Acidobacteria bacterium]|nr:hypothetical protein [Acidobacteriota bacterium]MCW5969717.1 hypothetical protein [Blastocatellales bacterium]
MQSRTKKRIARELLILVQYFVISALAAIWAFDSYTTGRFGQPEEGVDINSMGLLRVIWSSYLKPWMTVFLGLCLVRLVILFFFLSRDDEKQR